MLALAGFWILLDNNSITEEKNQCDFEQNMPKRVCQHMEIMLEKK